MRLANFKNPHQGCPQSAFDQLADLTGTGPYRVPVTERPTDDADPLGIDQITINIFPDPDVDDNE
ncbi:hypothetical protein [Streptomyces sp. NPDC048357]|uniref:hypothetical protein n=1 Tax=Streptomyces sp. NPDC048357 TaxID=3154719 RepID=UPI0034306052